MITNGSSLLPFRTELTPHRTLDSPSSTTEHPRKEFSPQHSMHGRLNSTYNIAHLEFPLNQVIWLVKSDSHILLSLCIMVFLISLLGCSSKFPKDFSTGSRSHFEKYILSKKPRCLLQTLVPKNLMMKPVCGNQLLEAGEDCDCGSPKVWKHPRLKTFTRELLWHRNYAVFFSFSF